jgi:hypothetical protein
MRSPGRKPVDRFLLGLILLGFLLAGFGCASTKKAEQPPPKGQAEKIKAAKGPMPVTYDFKDILVPAELSLDRKKSFVYSTPSFAAGVLVFEGYVSGESLLNFFTSNMAKDGWILRSSFRYGRAILNFEKGERSCLINIAESPFNTQVEIWVAPQITGVMP